MSQKQKPSRTADRMQVCPELQPRPSLKDILVKDSPTSYKAHRIVEVSRYTCILIEEGKLCNRVNYDEQAYPWGLCISLPLQKDKEA